VEDVVGDVDDRHGLAIAEFKFTQQKKEKSPKMIIIL
jgi:hypothetical protein